LPPITPRKDKKTKEREQIEHGEKTSVFVTPLMFLSSRCSSFLNVSIRNLNYTPITPKSKKQTAYGVRLKIENIKRIKTTEEVEASSSV